MSQRSVERIIGVLATDEGLRRRFITDPRAALIDMMERGIELTECERWALSRIDARELARFAEAIDARLQKMELGRPS